MHSAPSPNFAFLGHHDPRLVALGTQAEEHFATDPNVTLYKLRQFCEVLAKRAAAKVGLLLDPREELRPVIDVVPHPTIQRTKFHLVVGGKNKAVLEVFREVERRVIGAAAAGIRDDAIQRAVEVSTGQLSLLNAPPATDPSYDELHGRDVALAVADVKTLVAQKGAVVFDELWPEVLQERHLTLADLRKIVWQMRQAGAVVVQNLGARERSIKGAHVIALRK